MLQPATKACTNKRSGRINQPIDTAFSLRHRYVAARILVPSIDHDVKVDVDESQHDCVHSFELLRGAAIAKDHHMTKEALFAPKDVDQFILSLCK